MQTFLLKLSKIPPQVALNSHFFSTSKQCRQVLNYQSISTEQCVVWPDTDLLDVGNKREPSESFLSVHWAKRVQVRCGSSWTGISKSTQQQKKETSSKTKSTAHMLFNQFFSSFLFQSVTKSWQFSTTVFISINIKN